MPFSAPPAEMPPPLLDVAMRYHIGTGVISRILHAHSGGARFRARSVACRAADLPARGEDAHHFAAPHAA